MAKKKIKKNKEVQVGVYIRFNRADAFKDDGNDSDNKVLDDIKKSEIAIGGEMINGKVSSSYSGNEKDALK